MIASLKRFGFAATVLGLVLAMGIVVLGKSVFFAKPGDAAHSGPPPGSGKAGKGAGKGPDAPSVVATTVSEQTFYDVVQALGTAQARESITVSAKVTDVIRAIRFDSGDRVARGQVLVELSSIEQSADLLEARASFETAERDWARFKDLGEKGFASRQRVEAARASYDQAAARVAAMESRIGDRIIRAPFAGTIGLRTASPGALVRPGDAIATLDDTSQIKLDFDVPETQIAAMRTGGEILARAAAAPDREFHGKIADIDTRLDPQSRTLKVRAIIPNPDGVLKPGMLLSVEVRSNPRKALAAPEIAVLERSDGSYLYTLVAQDGRKVVKPQLVATGQRSGGRVEILSGVGAGTEIVMEGVQRARPGQPAKVTEVRAPAPAAEPVVAPHIKPAAPKPSGLRGTSALPVERRAADGGGAGPAGGAAE